MSNQCYISFVYRLNLLGGTDIQVQPFLIEILFKHWFTLTPKIAANKTLQKVEKINFKITKNFVIKMPQS